MASMDPQPNEKWVGETDYIAQAVRAYRQLQRWREAHPEADLAAIEKQVRQIRRPLMGSLMKTLLDTRESRPECPTCSKRMGYQGDREIEVLGLEGDFELERGYYYCRSCKEGFSPPG